MCSSLFVCLALLAAASDQPRKATVKTADVHIRDPFVLPVPAERKFYLYGSAGPARGFYAFRSTDLENWEGPLTVFQAGPDFWATHNFWAPEVHFYKGKYYMLASFKAEGVCRGTQILVSDEPAGPFEPLTEKPVTPSDWECLDGTLYVDPKGKPWMVFCHEWLQIRNGEMCAIPLSSDLKSAVGKAVVLFKATEAKWVRSIDKNDPAYVTDGPFIYRTKSGKLLMLWSSFGDRGYTTGVATSKSGAITGPWVQATEPLDIEDAGHSMLFRTFRGKLILSLHQPNGGGNEHPVLIPAETLGEALAEE